MPMMSPKAVMAVGLLLALAAGCGGGLGGSDGGGGTGTAGTGGTTGVGGASGSTGAGGAAGTTGTGGTGGTGVPCGGATCRADQVCVHPSCGGGVQVCIPLGDAGQCPSGWVMTDQCSSGSGPGCVPPVCDPPPPRCADVPAACSGAPTCTCLPSSVCTQSNGQTGGSCGFVSEANVICGSA